MLQAGRGCAVETLVQLTRALTNAPDVRAALHAVAPLVREAFDADECAIVAVTSGEHAGRLAGFSTRAGVGGAPSTPNGDETVAFEHATELDRVLAAPGPVYARGERLRRTSAGAAPAADAAGSIVMTRLGRATPETFVLHLWFADGRAPVADCSALLEVVTNCITLALARTPRTPTAQRQAEVELRRAEEFLRRVIDSSVDAIVSADMRGRVLLFNRAAARIFGYEPADVIGKMHVEKLYPPGVAREVMRKIRSPSHGGRHRLEDYRVDMLGSNGDPIPVNISAALILERDKPIGSVGVFTDIREKLRMEARLQRAQEELRERERSLALAALAGTTAHELNQPLTGVIGYAELLIKRVEPGSPLREALGVILSEAERMAEIVRKIGKITKYETQSYLGGVNILDLERAAPSAKDGS